MSILLVTNPPISEQTIWIVVGSAGLVVLYLLMRPRKQKETMARVPSFPLHRQREVEEQMSNLLVELSNMARQITAQLDTRAARLELLIKEADEKLAALHSAGRFVPSIAREDVAPQVDESDLPGRTALAEAPSSTEATIDPPTPTAVPPSPPAIDSRHADVYSLADGGRSAAEIARLLSRPTGEIELILALRPR